MDLIITGATGFIGAHFTTSWLRQHPDARVLCLVRASDGREATRRLECAIEGALLDHPAGSGGDALLDRTEAVGCALDDTKWVEHVKGWLRGPAEFFHCAANLSFHEADRAMVWHTNVLVTTMLLDAIATLPAIGVFNYVSTAYVAGDREGEIAEDDVARPVRFNNPYEESKWTAEGIVRAACCRQGIAWRVFRPSIVIAHSVTHRLASQSGFYKVASILLRLGERARSGSSREPIELPISPETTLDLVPVDMVVSEMLALMDAGPRSANSTFHITSPRPLSLSDVLNELSPMSGIVIQARDPAQCGEVAESSRMLASQLRHYMPYLGIVRRFKRKCAPPGMAVAPALDIETLRDFVRSFLLQQTQPAFAQGGSHSLQR